MRYAQIYSRLLSSPWFIDETTLTAITTLLESRMNSALPGRAAGGLARRKPVAHDDNPDLEGSDDEEDDPCPLPEIPGVSVIRMFGVLGKHLSALEMACGGCDMDAIARQVDQAMADPAVQKVVLYIDSPGGMAIGCHELFTHLFQSKTKPLYAYTDVLCGSAAYYIASAADALFVAPTARVGSIGTLLMVCDASKAYEEQGVKFTLLKSGEWKGLGDPRVPMSKEGLAILQNLVDKLGSQFRADVMKSRPSVDKADMEGLAYLGADAVERKLADGVVLDLATFLKGI
ncbi:MAG TPA: S49 family peptidase [Lacunisphaera sp.]|nr:S49 family peptidase [Lacunisphaera sp.]